MTDEQKKGTLRRYEKAKEAKNIETLKNFYAYTCPRRYPAAKGEKTNEVAELYDSTAIDAVTTKAAKVHNQLFPPFREWISPEPAIIIPKDIIPAWEEHKKKAKENIHKAVEISNFHDVVDDVIIDSFACDGALGLFSGTPEDPFIFEAADWDCFFTENDYKGRPNNTFFRRNISLDHILFKWPKAKIPEELQDDINNREKTFEVMDCFLYDDRKDNFKYEVWIVDGSHLVYEVESEPTSVWTVFRFFTQMRGQVGYGLVRDVMPDILTSNEVTKLILQNAAFAIGGLWQVDDDGVFNAETAIIKPGAVIPKDPSSKGLVPLETHRNFDVSQFILSDQQEKITKKIMGNTLPNIKDGVRSATEYYARKEEQSDRDIPVAAKIAKPQDDLLRRMYQILTSPKMKSSPYYIEPFSYQVEGRITPVKVRIKAANPLIRLQTEVDANNSLKAVASACQIFGPEAVLAEIKNSDFIRQFLEDNDFDPQFFKSEKEKKQDEETRRAEQERMLAFENSKKQKTARTGQSEIMLP